MEEPPPNSIIDTTLLADVEVAEVVVMCRGVRLFIRVRGQDLDEDDANGPSALRTLFVEYLKKQNDDPGVVDEFEEWALAPFVDIIRAHAPEKMPAPFSVMAYYAPQTLFFSLISVNGALIPRQFTGSVLDTQYLEPRVKLSALTRSGASISNLTRGQALHVIIDPHSDPEAYEFCAIPRTVTVPNLGFPEKRYFFKAASSSEELDRELDVYTRCAIANTVCVPRLIALVEWPEDGDLMGFLTEHIDCTGTLADHGSEASADTREKWMTQIRATVEELHLIGCVCGDVKPGNVLIDIQGNARVVDFGGGHSPHWVDGGLAESKEGDLQGLGRIQEYLEL